MKTKVIITPAHTLSGYQMQFYFEGTWCNYGRVHAYKKDADEYMRVSAAHEGWRLKEVRVVPAVAQIPAEPSQDYIETIWLKGYQAARCGGENPYGPSNNQILFQEGMDAFHAGLQLFA